MTKVPVLIAARNEASLIGRTLEALTTQAEPIVIPNGCTDQTAEIAERFGATIIHTDVEGKMTALQAGIRHLGKRALEPFITLDADSRPIFPKRWLSSLLNTRYLLPEDEPAVVTGAIVFMGGTSVVSSTYRTARNIQVHIATRGNANAGSIVGGNMLIHPVRSYVVDAIQELSQIWPGDDASIKDLIVENGGGVQKSLNPGAMIFSDSSRYKGLLRRILDGREKSQEEFNQSYIDDAPPNSITGSEFKYLRSLGRNGLYYGPPEIRHA